MKMTREEFAQYIRSFDFKGLFNYLGWDRPYNSMTPIELKDNVYSFEIVAQKSQFAIIVCNSQGGNIPPYPVRSRIDNEIKRRIHEHMLIFCDSAKKEQVWLYTYTTNGRSRKAQVNYNINQEPERLYQRASGLFFSIDEQDRITIFDVTERMSSNFGVNTEKVTKKFYDGFKKQHKNFMTFMDGVTDKVDKQWYTSIMLNRLMFCYFMQKRGFLNNDRDYLRHKLSECAEKIGKDKFYSFYRSFLLVLFHKGFAEPTHDGKVIELIGNIPYLNGGLFDVHEIENRYPDIQIDDRAFNDVFDLFDAYEWHLDSRDCASGNEISPDVLGYIFEKYINDRAQMGAYYTQEDITEYIGRNCIIPYLFGQAEDKYKDIFAPNRELWTMLRESGNKYIFDSMKKGVELKLPDNIEVGVRSESPNLLEQRKCWNEFAPEEYALPTEIWREVVERRQRYVEIANMIEAGGILSIKDFITYNLDICSFAQDAIDTIDDPAFIRVMYDGISRITVLDPTCGSGAFLFAALNILEPLYDSCISRMEDFVESGKMLPKMTRKLFEDTLKNKDAHPNKQYFIVKSIILNNLYGVDIMNEAVETAKLRLFLKLVSTATPNYYADNIGIEPLPDIDFNIKCGNSLVGYANEQDVLNELNGNLVTNLLREEVLEKLRHLSMATRRFKERQLETGENYTEFREAKELLNARQNEVNDVLNKTISGIDLDDDSYNSWFRVTNPFHWVAEFYSIISKDNGNGGFDVIIGNPPYLEEGQINYTVKGFETIDSKAVHAYCIERSSALIHRNGTFSMIVPLALVSTQRMKIVHKIINANRDVFYSNYSWRPGRLFDTVNRALTIFVALPGCGDRYTTRYIKWNSATRETLFTLISYTRFDDSTVNDVYWIGKIAATIENSILSKLTASKRQVSTVIRPNGSSVYYKSTGGLYWKVFTNFAPAFLVNGVKGHSSREKKIKVKNSNEAYKMIALLSSSLFWWWYTVTSNLRDLNPSDIYNFYLPKDWENCSDLVELGKRYSADLKRNSNMIQRVQRKTGTTRVQSFKIQKSKGIIDEIDICLATYFGFSQIELDYIINYDIKYRLGADSNDNE